MATTYFCEIAARYLDILETDGLEAAAESASEAAWSATYYEGDDEDYEAPYCHFTDCVDFVAQRLEAMYQDQHCDETKTIAEPQPTAIAIIKTAIRHEQKWLVQWIVKRGFENSLRYANRQRKFWHWEVVDVHGDREEIYTQHPLTIAQVLEILPPQSAVRVTGLSYV